MYYSIQLNCNFCWTDVKNVNWMNKQTFGNTLWRKRCNNEWWSSLTKIKSTKWKLKYKDVWHLTTKHGNIGFSLSKFEEAFRGKNTKILFASRLFENSWILRTRKNTRSRLWYLQNYLWQQHKLATTFKTRGRILSIS